MTITLSEKEARRAKLREERRLRERKNRCWTNLKPHLHELVDELAEEGNVAKNTMVRILILEALKARGIDLDEVFRKWKARQEDAERD